MTALAITGIGLASARGDVDAVLAGGDIAARSIPWTLRDTVASRCYRPAQGFDAALVGRARFDALVERAVAGAGAAPIRVIGSCNGTIATWDEQDWQASFDSIAPAASAACASGMHALFLARQLLMAGAPAVTVIGADLASAPAHDNFEALRLLSDAPSPFCSDASGFMLGEAAVALRVECADASNALAYVDGPVLGHDLDGDDGISRTLAQLAPHDAELVIGQGAGPVEVDRAELAAIAQHVPAHVVLATALDSFGHTLGASSLLSIALAALATKHELRTHDGGRATDGRPLGFRRSAVTAVVCRALGGACGAAVVSAAQRGDAALNSARLRAWVPASVLPPLRDPLLRSIAETARAQRPTAPPDVLLVTLAAPRPPSARIGQRILPTSVLEMTPGFVPQLIARAWGYTGPALCLVGGDPMPLISACRANHERVYRVAIRGMHERDVEWDA